MQAVQSVEYPKIPSRLVKDVQRYLPKGFVDHQQIVLRKEVSNAEKDRYCAAIMAVADYLLHMSVDTSGAEVAWQGVNGMAMLRNRANMLEIGWKLRGNKVTHFDEHHWNYAFSWLRRVGYLLTLSEDGFDRNATYTPTADLIKVFVATLS